jgi:hypothetical protein
MTVRTEIISDFQNTILEIYEEPPLVPVCNWDL